MAVLTSIRQITRNDDGLSLRINFEDWASDVPLPPQASLVGFGENHEWIIYPEWRFAFHPDAAYDVLTGMFKVALSLEETVSWFRNEMNKLGWVQAPEKWFVEPTWASLKFHHPITFTRVNMSLRWREEPFHDTQITIWRVRKHSYPPPTEASAETRGNGAETHPATDDFSSDAEARSEWQRGIDLVVKVSDIFKELAGGRAVNLYPTLFPDETRDAIERALGGELDAETASRLAFHLVDWNGDAAFLVALLLFPERFTPEEIRAGVTDFLIHAPNHVAAAAELGGWPVGDIFKGGLVDKS